MMRFIASLAAVLSLAALADAQGPVQRLFARQTCSGAECGAGFVTTVPVSSTASVPITDGSGTVAAFAGYEASAEEAPSSRFPRLKRFAAGVKTVVAAPVRITRRGVAVFVEGG